MIPPVPIDFGPLPSSFVLDLLYVINLRYGVSRAECSSLLLRGAVLCHSLALMALSDVSRC